MASLKKFLAEKQRYRTKIGLALIIEHLTLNFNLCSVKSSAKIEPTQISI